MRPRVEWMNQTDDRVLELLEESGLELTPAALAHNMDYSRSWISRRMSKMADAGLVKADEDGYYGSTDRGRAYLSGDLDAEELEE